LAGEKIHGVYASLSSHLPGTVFEPHALYRTRAVAVDDRGLAGHSGIWTAGFRLSGNPRPNWDFDLELDWQFGTYGSSDLKAWRALSLLGYSFREVRLKPRLLAEYSFATGDALPGDGRIGTFDQLYIRAHRLRGIVDQVGDRNSKSLRAGAEIHPHPNWTIAIDQYSFWLANTNDGLYRHSGLLVVPRIPGGARSAHIGEEIDVTLEYQPAPHLTIGAGFGFLAAGKFLKERTPGGSPAQTYVVLQLDL
jgi:hypothetical protein